MDPSRPLFQVKDVRFFMDHATAEAWLRSSQFSQLSLLRIQWGCGPSHLPQLNIPGLVVSNIAIEHGPFIADLMIYLLKMVVFHSDVSLPEGISTHLHRSPHVHLAQR